MSEPNWQAIAALLYSVAKTAGDRCEYERNAAGVPIWYLNPESNQLERKLITKCSRCIALESYEATQT